MTGLIGLEMTPERDFNPYSAPDAPVGNFIESRPPGPAWLMIFFRPRSTIRRILDSGKTTAELPLVMIFGLDCVLPTAFRQYRAGKMAFKEILFKFLGQGLGGPVIGLFVLGFVIWLTGRWIGGKASQKEIRTAMAWASIPFIPLLLVELLAIGFFDISLGMGPRTRPQAYALIGVLIVKLVFGVWGLFLWANAWPRPIALAGSRRLARFCCSIFSGL
jgi:Yip1 domain